MQAVTAMEPEEKTAELATGEEDRRTVPRHGVDEDASLLLVNHGSTFPCRIVDLSLGGCCLRTKERFTAGSMVRVEATFRARGLSFRFSGITQWTDSRNLVGIRFVDVPLRRREELVEALFEVEAENAAKAAQRAAEKRAAEEQAAVREAEEEAQRQTPVQIPAPAEPDKYDRRAALREQVDTSAVMDIVKTALQLRGSIVDLSLSGCRIRVDERFPADIDTWVETEFRLNGLPFRLGGIVQVIYDQHTVGIRFLYRSNLMREQVKELIEDIREMKEQGLGIRG